MMSMSRKSNASERMCSTLFNEPVSRLSTQVTRWPRRSSSSHRCDPRNPAPPVTRQVAMDLEGIAYCGFSAGAQHRARARPAVSARAGGLELLLGNPGRDHVDAQIE